MVQLSWYHLSTHNFDPKKGISANLAWQCCVWILKGKSPQVPVFEFPPMTLMCRRKILKCLALPFQLTLHLVLESHSSPLFMQSLIHAITLLLPLTIPLHCSLPLPPPNKCLNIDICESPGLFASIYPIKMWFISLNRFYEAKTIFSPPCTLLPP